MVAVRKNPYRAETEEEARTLVAETKIEYVICANRQHRFPNLDPRDKDLPPGFRVGPIRKDGLFDVTEVCQVCGEEVWYLSRADQIFGSKRKRNYKRPPDRPIIPRGMDRSGIYADELNAEMSNAIVAAAKRAAKAAERAAARKEQRSRNKPLKSVS